MTEVAFFDQLYKLLVTVLVGLARVVPCLTLMPIFSFKIMAGLLRITIAIVFCIYVLPLLAQEPTIQNLMRFSPVSLVLIFFKEAVLGFFLGGLLALPFWVVTAVGELFDSSRGALSGQQLNPATGMDSSITDDLLRQLVLILWLAMGGLAWTALIIGNSYKIWGLGDWWPRVQELAWQSYLGYIQEAFTMLVHLSAPLIIVLVLAESIIAIMSVHTPRMQAYFLAMPLKAIIGIGMLIIYQQYFQPVMRTWLNAWYGYGWIPP